MASSYVKFFLHVSKEEQQKRFLERIENPDKNWKFSLNDVNERQHWDEYMEAYEDTIRHTASEDAPWYVVPADQQMVHARGGGGGGHRRSRPLDLHYPEVSAAKQEELAAARKALLAAKSATYLGDAVKDRHASRHALQHSGTAAHPCACGSWEQRGASMMLTPLA